MKRNFIVTTGLIDAWEFNENNFLLGNWCEFYENNNFDKNRFDNKILEKTTIIKNIHHWNDYDKRIKDYEYLKKKIEYLLEIISNKLSAIHNVKEDKEYWRIIIYNWLNQYAITIFDRWESVRIFFEKNKDKKFYTNFIPFNELDYLPKSHVNFEKNSQKDEWNHLIFLRLFNFLNIQKLSLIEKKIAKNNLNQMLVKKKNKQSIISLSIDIIDNIVSKFAFKFNRIIFESFSFPKKEYLKICLRCKLIPAVYSNFFDFDIKESNLLKNDKRIKLKNLLLNIDTQDKFIQFLLSNLHKDIPKSYLENFDKIKEKFLPFAKKKKIIISMHSIFHNDNFKIYLAEAKKVGSKYIHTIHGGGIKLKIYTSHDMIEKISDKIITWDNTEQNKDLFVNLSPTLPIIKLKNPKFGNDCSIVLYELRKYILKFPTGPVSDQLIEFFGEMIQFVNKLNPEIKSKVKFRLKGNGDYNFAKNLPEMFGKKNIDLASFNNPFEKTILNSKLIIVTYPQTAFSVAMYSNIPTILISKDHWKFSETALHTFNDLKKNNIVFENFNEAEKHINKNWKEINLWWKSENVQFARKRFLANYFNVKSNWHKEWSDYIYFSLPS